MVTMMIKHNREQAEGQCGYTFMGIRENSEINLGGMDSQFRYGFFNNDSFFFYKCLGSVQV